MPARRRERVRRVYLAVSSTSRLRLPAFRLVTGTGGGTAADQCQYWPLDAGRSAQEAHLATRDTGLVDWRPATVDGAGRYGCWASMLIAFKTTHIDRVGETTSQVSECPVPRRRIL